MSRTTAWASAASTWASSSRSSGRWATRSPTSPRAPGSGSRSAGRSSTISADACRWKAKRGADRSSPSRCRSPRRARRRGTWPRPPGDEGSRSGRRPRVFEDDLDLVGRQHDPDHRQHEERHEAQVLVEDDAWSDGPRRPHHGRCERLEEAIDDILVALGARDHPENALAEQGDARDLGERLQNYDNLVHPVILALVDGTLAILPARLPARIVRVQGACDPRVRRSVAGESG